MIDRTQAWNILEAAELLHGEAEIAQAIDRVAVQIVARLRDTEPLVLAVMGGGVVFAGQLLPRLRFPLEFDFIHVTRYRGGTTGGEVRWPVAPHVPLKDRTVLVVDDILDEGRTLAAVRERFLSEGVRAFHSAVLCEKLLQQEKPVRADYVGVTVPDRYVFGCGMDVNGAWRNLPGIYAVGRQP
ncbi:MAG: hypoxanthine-guanine phosphoribosyltransferase [Rhodocyclaceae bacterium]|jgi:hypoxanthine phosphoribosyltransferase|nr:hypoxanthine-guanine phosphoribosyltransferase [Rhodocyclaceae bacterium]MCE2978607.1 hypoxanthine-guanine phosphoribosyltransferase [Betaproteobacteria bacterium]MCA3074665.1 hypoxanthine-guanine phosphoribosyltransferase [Rhodocyclaceae bacterium]MCA3088862.1 hypoxanthine-guanine phosphoribosyltransferase [Rhodocyclaceae bacterium]MCA3095598.1 hypoxanthine-guanine phosphoribosyltransferase [Rhodocyclaceae bacterium]